MQLRYETSLEVKRPGRVSLFVSGCVILALHRLWLWACEVQAHEFFVEKEEELLMKEAEDRQFLEDSDRLEALVTKWDEKSP